MLVISIGSNAQLPDSSRWGSVYVAGGTYLLAGQPLFRGDLDRLAPGSVLLTRDLSDHTFSNDRFAVGSGSFDISIGMHPCARNGRSGPELRLGLTYAGADSQGAYYERTTRTPYDTLTSSQTGEQRFVDSVFRSNYSIVRSAERFGLNASMIWRTDRRWSFYGGAGLAGGVIMNARTSVRYDESRSIDGLGAGYLYGDQPYGSTGDLGEQELFRNGTGWWIAAYIPVGLDFGLARRSPFWSRLHLYYELRPQLIAYDLPELRTYVDVGLQTLFGARLKL